MQWRSSLHQALSGGWRDLWLGMGGAKGTETLLPLLLWSGVRRRCRGPSVPSGKYRASAEVTVVVIVAAATAAK